MQIACVHCGKSFTIAPEQFGTRGRCPHCRGEIRLPKATDPAVAQEAEQPEEPSHWWENSVSAMASLVFHLVVILLLAVVKFGGPGLEGLAGDVLIGDIPAVQLGDSQSEELAPESQPASAAAAEELNEMLEVAPPVDITSDSAESFRDEALAIVAPSSGGGDTGSSFDLGAVSIGGGSMGGGSWDGMVQQLRRNGLDIVLTFDSTSSMGGEIDQVKSQIRRLGGALLKLVPKARIGLCTYRDDSVEFLVRGLPLTRVIVVIERFLSGIEADGGGDEPEAVHEGLRWSIEQNQFRPGSRKVILLFGDAPPHAQFRQTCLNLASDFAREKNGIVSTVTCRGGERMLEFIEIADMGGGEAFLTSDERQIMEQLLVLVFGAKHREKVRDAFEVLGR